MKLGIKLKIKYFDDYRGADFCGNVVSDFSSDATIADPVKYMCDVWLTPNKYMLSRPGIRLGLLRARAISGIDAHAGTPMLGALFYAILKRTRSITPHTGEMDVYHLQRFEAARRRLGITKEHLRSEEEVLQAPSPTARVLMFEKFGFDFAYQQRFERAMLNWASGSEEPLPVHPRLSEHFALSNLMLREEHTYVEERVWNPCFNCALTNPNEYYTRDGELDKSLCNYHPATQSYSARVPQSSLQCVIGPVVP
jgi:hypothetical protein